MPPHWNKIIAHVDMDAFFAAIEQRDFPELQGKPVAVTNGIHGSCIITCSYEARAFGVKTGMRLTQARQLCPNLIQRPSRPTVYAITSQKIMQALAELTPDLEIFSVDEAFLEFTYCKTLYRSAKAVIECIRNTVLRASGLTCSVGLSGDKTTAKYAAKCNKPDGYKIIPPWHARATLAPLPVTALCGIAHGIARYLAQHQVYYCGDMAKLPIGVLSRRFGRLGIRIWHMAQGLDPAPLVTTIKAPKTIGHGKVMPPNTKDEHTLLCYLSHMAEKVASRLRQHQLEAQFFHIGLLQKTGWCAAKCKMLSPTAHGPLIFAQAKQLVVASWQGDAVLQCQITALGPQPAHLQADLFAQEDQPSAVLDHTIDAINDKFGGGTVTNGLRMTPLTMPPVISPAWRPEGHRSTIHMHDAPAPKKTQRRTES